MAVTQICPLCDSPNPLSAEHCSCGYTFPTQRARSISRMWRGIAYATLGGLLMILASLDLVDYFDLPVGVEVLALAAFVAVLAGAWTFVGGLVQLKRR